MWVYWANLQVTRVSRARHAARAPRAGDAGGRVARHLLARATALALAAFRATLNRTPNDGHRMTCLFLRWEGAIIPTSCI